MSFINSKITNAGLVVNAYDMCFMIDFFKTGKRFITFQAIGGNVINHAIYVYGIKTYENGTFKLRYFDPQTNRSDFASSSDLMQTTIITLN